MPDRESTLIPDLKEVRSGFSCLALVVSAFSSGAIQAVEGEGVVAGEFEARIKPLLEQYCYDCHGDGASKGEVSLDDPVNGIHKLDNQELWLRVWKNLRSDLMPPAKKSQPNADERAEVISWIQRKVFGLDPANPDPGRVTLRRLNRVEYGHSVEDILGVKFNVNDAFPPDDTGYGFDTIGDVLSISPLLMEKYLAVAERIMAQAIPLEAGRPQAVKIDPGRVRNEKNRSRSARFMRVGSAHRAGMSGKPRPRAGTVWRSVTKWWRRVAGRMQMLPGECWWTGRSWPRAPSVLKTAGRKALSWNSAQCFRRVLVDSILKWFLGRAQPARIFL